MTKAKLFIGLTAIIGAMLSSAAPAFAEFESQSGATQGKAELVGTVLEAGGGTVTCKAPTEESSKAKWTIKNEKGKRPKALTS